MRFFKRTIAQDIARELDETERARRAALNEREYWTAAHRMLTEREQRLRAELAVQAALDNSPGEQT